MDQAHKAIIDEITKNDAVKVDAKHVSGQRGHDNIYADSKNGKTTT